MRLIALTFIAFLMSACGAPPANNGNSPNTSNIANSATPAVQTLTVVDTPQRVKDIMASRGEQDSAQPTLKIVEPAANSTVNSSTVKVKLSLTGDLKGSLACNPRGAMRELANDRALGRGCKSQSIFGVHP
jgi:hypothetical protein